MPMLKNYLMTALRTLAHQKGYAALNVAGLAVGLACFALIALFVRDELAYDRFHEKADRTYRVIQRRVTTTGPTHWSVTSPALATMIRDRYPEVVATTTVGTTYKPMLRRGDRFYEDDGILTDAAFFDVFTFPLLQGDPKTALADPGGIVLTETMARTLFGDADPMGQTLLYRDEGPHTVTGVMADVPETSHLTFQYILPIASDEFYREGLGKPVWNNNGWYTYAVLAEGASAAPVEAGLKAFVDANMADQPAEDRTTFLFQPLTEIHLRPPVGMHSDGDLGQVRLFMGIGLLILLLACVNYTNLAVAQSLRRRHEVGVRQALGAHRWQLIAQFLGESLLTTFLAGLVALGLAYLLRPVLESLVERPIALDVGGTVLVPGLLALVVVVGILAGFYPALVATSQRPVQTLRGETGGRRGPLWIQRALIVGQYAASIALVAGGLVVLHQIRFMQNQDLGYDRDHVLTIQADDEAISQSFPAIRDALLQDPRVVAVGYSKHLPTNVGNFQEMSGWEGSGDERLQTMTTSVDYDVLDVHGIDVVAGRGFSPETDALGAPVALVNETVVRTLGWTPEEAVGQTFEFSDGEGTRTIVGVIGDIHVNSIRSPLEPLVLTLDRNPTGYISAKVRPDDLPGTIAMAERVIAAHSSYPFVYAFMDDQFDKLYAQEARLGDTIRFFALLAFLVASLGLFGLTAYAAARRAKEVSIRKVLGASVGRLVLLLTRDTVLLVVLSFTVGAPLAYVAASRWLQAFTYHIEPGAGLFLVAGGSALAAALLAVSLHVVRAATVDPVHALRSE